jgi:pentapeptide MXKDX repeat protein
VRTAAYPLAQRHSLFATGRTLMRGWILVTAVALVAAMPAAGYAQTPSDKMKDEKMMKDDKMKMDDKMKHDKMMKDDKMKKDKMKKDKMMEKK